MEKFQQKLGKYAMKLGDAAFSKKSLPKTQIVKSKKKVTQKKTIKKDQVKSKASTVITLKPTNKKVG